MSNIGEDYSPSIREGMPLIQKSIEIAPRLALLAPTVEKVEHSDEELAFLQDLDIKSYCRTLHRLSEEDPLRLLALEPRKNFTSPRIGHCQSLSTCPYRGPSIRIFTGYEFD